MNIINRICTAFGFGPAAEPTTVDPTEAALLANKLKDHLSKIGYRLSVPMLKSDRLDVLIHDLHLAIMHGDLRGGRVDVLNQQNTGVIFSWDFEIARNRNRDWRLIGHTPDLRIILNGVGRTKLIVRFGDRLSEYRDRFKLVWPDEKERLPRLPGATLMDAGAERSTGGRLAARTFVADTNKVECRVEKVLPAGYAFLSTQIGVRDVFAHPSEVVQNGSKFRGFARDMRVKALLQPNRRRDGSPGLAAKQIEVLT